MAALLSYIYQELIFNGSLIAGVLFGLLSLAFHFKILSLRTCKIITIALIILCTGISIEFYAYQLSQSYINLLIPISVIIMMIDFFLKPITPIVLKIICLLNITYLALGLGLLASSNNTWGNVGAIIGMFIVPNTLLTVMYLSFTIKNYTFLSISFVIATILSLFCIYKITYGFQYSEYDGAIVKEKRWTAIAICLLFFVNGILYYLKRKRAKM